MPASIPRRWGWHRLDSRVAATIVAGAGIRPGDLVLDIGAGDGALTDALVRAGARVVAFELHLERAEALRRRFASSPVRVVVADAADLRLPATPFRVVANPPFAVAMAVLRRLVAAGSRLESADVVVPRHIARRWRDGRVGGARRWAPTFDVSLAMPVPAGAFRPPAGRDAVVLRIRRVGSPPEGAAPRKGTTRRGRTQRRAGATPVLSSRSPEPAGPAPGAGPRPRTAAL